MFWFWINSKTVKGVQVRALKRECRSVKNKSAKIWGRLAPRSSLFPTIMEYQTGGRARQGLGWFSFWRSGKESFRHYHFGSRDQPALKVSSRKNAKLTINFKRCHINFDFVEYCKAFSPLGIWYTITSESNHRLTKYVLHCKNVL